MCILVGKMQWSQLKFLKMFKIWLITSTVHTDILHFIWISVHHCSQISTWTGHFHSAERSLCADLPWCKHLRRHRNDSQSWKWPIHVVHTHPMYVVRPDSLGIVGETSYGIWMGFIRTDIVIVIYLFISKERVCTCPVNQLPIVRPPPFTWTQISYAKNQQSLHSEAINLCNRWPDCMQPRLLDSIRLSLVSTEFFLFIFLLGFMVCLC